MARLDHGFERGLSDVSATHTLRGDGGISVINRGDDPGKACVIGEPDLASLKVSFIGPF